MYFMLEIFLNEFISAVFQLVAFSIIPVIWWFITARKECNYFKWIGLKRISHEKSIVSTILITLSAAAVYIILTYLCINLLSGDITTAGSQFAGMGISAVPAALIYAFIQTSLSEEIVFRGFILKRVANKFGFAAGNIVQAVLFGLMHGVPFGLASHNIVVTVLITIIPGAFGWYQGFLNEKRCGGSIFPSWILHGTMNFIVALTSL